MITRRPSGVKKSLQKNRYFASVLDGSSKPGKRQRRVALQVLVAADCKIDVLHCYILDRRSFTAEVYSPANSARTPHVAANSDSSWPTTDVVR